MQKSENADLLKTFKIKKKMFIKYDKYYLKVGKEKKYISFVPKIHNN